MGLLERVQKKAGDEIARPAVGNLPAAPEPTEVLHVPVTPGEVTATPAPKPMLAPLTPDRPKQPSTAAGRSAAQAAPKPSAAQAQFAKLKSRIHARLVEEMQDEDSAEREDIVAKITELVNETLASSGTPLPRNERARLVESLINDVLGLGPLEQLLNDPEITEIMINGPRQIYVEQAGKLYTSPVTFESNGQLLQVIDRVVSSIGRRVDESSPMVDARLKDGSRVNVIIPPLALNGPTMTIRKFAAEKYTADDLVKFNSITREMAEFLRACVRSRLNILVSGWHRLGQDHHPQHHLQLHPRRRAHRHRGGRRRAAAAAGARGHAGVAAAQRGGTRPRLDPRPRDQLPAHAAGPDRGG